jgi:hypothetical protein
MLAPQERPHGDDAGERRDNPGHGRHDGPSLAFGDVLRAEAADDCTRPASALQKTPTDDVDASRFKSAPPACLSRYERSSSTTVRERATVRVRPTRLDPHKCICR